MLFRKQVYISQNLKDFEDAKSALINHNIPFSTRISSGENPLFPIWSIFGDSKRNRRGMMFENKHVQNFYYIYVKKEYYKQAQYLINSR